MRKMLLLLALAGAAWYGYKSRQRAQIVQPVQPIQSPAQQFVQPAPVQQNFKCDGRVHCSEMTSCAEATFFIRNCPGTKMDGDNDGVPCESQFCG